MTRGTLTRYDPIEKPRCREYAGGNPVVEVDPEGLHYSKPRYLTREQKAQADQCLWQCFRDHHGLTAGTGAALFGTTPWPKRFRTLGSSPTTNLTGHIYHTLTKGKSHKLPFSVPTGMSGTRTVNVGRLLSRGTFATAIVLTAVDVYAIGNCSEACRANTQCTMGQEPGDY